MKAKYSVIPFVPAFLVMLYFKLMSIVGADGSGRFMGMDNTTITYIVLGITLGLFAVCVLINLFDRKTSPVYPVKKNVAAGLFAVLAGFAIMAYSLTTAVDAWQVGANQEYKLLTTICAAFSVPAGISLALMSRIHFAGKSVVSSMSMLYVFPSLWGCTELVNEFLQATKTSVSAKDLTRVFCFIFISLFFFSSSMVVSRIKGRNPVKGMFIYGLPMAAISLTFGIYELVALVNKSGVINSNLSQSLLISSDAAEPSSLMNYSIVLNASMLIACAAYALVFIFELFFNTYTKDDIEIINGLPDDEEKVFVDENDYAIAENNTAEEHYNVNDSDYAIAESNTAEEHYNVDDNDYVIPQSNTAEEQYKVDDMDLFFDTKPKKVKKRVKSSKNSIDKSFGFDENNSSKPEKHSADFSDKADVVFSENKSDAKSSRMTVDKTVSADEKDDIDDLVFSDRSNRQRSHVKFDDDYYSSVSGLDDFIMGYSYDDNNKKSKKSASGKSLKKQDKNERKSSRKHDSERKTISKTEKADKAEKKVFQSLRRLLMPKRLIKKRAKLLKPRKKLILLKLKRNKSLK